MKQRIRAVDLDAVRFEEGFWRSRQQVNRTVTIPLEYEQLKNTHRLSAIEGTWTPDSGYTPHVFWDSDIAKWLEAAAYSLHTHPDPQLEAQCDRIIDCFMQLQDDSGYINSYFSQVAPQARWSNLRDSHELYCAGHLMEAACAYFHATGKRNLLDAMCRYADYIASVFGTADNQMRGYPGHEEIELALVRLAETSGNCAYLRLSEYFVNQRGIEPHYFDEEAIKRGENPADYLFDNYAYLQAHQPVRRQRTADGHSVRACYLYSGMADLARKTDDKPLAEACRAVWKNITRTRMYIHGGIGSSHIGERFTFDYDLPNEAAYAETCAAIALVFFAQRMFLLDPKTEYIDVLERALYNGVISGISLDGTRFFYDNYLASHPGYHQFQNRQSPDRQAWFGCACCPPNIARLLASLGTYVVAQSGADIWINLYAACSVDTQLPGLSLDMHTRYPRDGRVSVTVRVATPVHARICFRIPAWCNDWSMQLNGTAAETRTEQGYALLDREWSNGDTIVLDMQMPVQRIHAHPSVRHNTGKVALQRGPLVYCLEETDNGADLANIYLPDQAELVSEEDDTLLGGVVTIRGTALSISQDGWEDQLYSPTEGTAIARPITAVPYYAWNNRESGEMIVWINTARRH